ncbi:MAG TPA: sigma 54-interacting transcriptional regulator [Candidatus Krumholzibacteria bacterium]|nr:sigma 54-interacting transcriptional regulator [Candidatus Krumholzibacteria bacterium]HPD70143.1 sigma 54-interacting transcriptional regulator [Candidatus Krumholzibacteria bacterium]HRY40157.1 sigma 54-interacting transcriptional regulator [Candidatus Krumholzibacteria bacterium]
MADLDGHDHGTSRREGLPGQALAQEFERLESVGDLYFHAAAYATALDYYGRILADDVIGRLTPVRALAVLANAVKACLHLGWTDRADRLLAVARGYLADAPDLPPETRSIERACFQVPEAVLLMQRAGYDAAIEVASEAFATLAFTDRHAEIAGLQLTLGACHHSLGRLAKAEEYYLDSLSTYRRIGDEIGEATLDNALAMLHKAACRWNEALALLDKAAMLARRHGAPQLLAVFDLNRGIVLAKVDRLDEAEQALAKSLALSRRLGDRLREPRALLAFGRLDLRRGRLDQAEERFRTGRILAEREGMRRDVVIADESLGDASLARGDLDQALAFYERGLAPVRSLVRAGDLETELLRRLAEVHRRRGDLATAIAEAHAAIAVGEDCGELYELGFCHLTLAEAHAAAADWDRADGHFREALGRFKAQSLVREWGDAACRYLEIRLASADRPCLLALRGLMAAVPEEAAARGRRGLQLAGLSGLTRVQLRLGHYDDALLTVFEFERVAREGADTPRLAEAARLRRLVEVGLLGMVRAHESPVSTLAGVPGLFQAGDGRFATHLDRVLATVADRTRAACGFLALASPADPCALRVAARQDLADHAADRLLRWYAERADGGAARLICSRVDAGGPPLDGVPALAGRPAGCVFLPIAAREHRLGLLFLGLAAADASRPAIAQATLDFLVNYLGVLGIFLAEKSRGRTAEPTAIRHEGFESILTADARMLEMLALIRKVAPSDLTVLLRGETGTGKGMLAQALHRLSPRGRARFQSINCAAIPETLLESELFGHVRGAFTGADIDKKGLLLEAVGGTVFLDEIGKMPLAMQGKLLQFLDTRVVRPVGSNEEREVDVRIVCASKADLSRMVESDRFLEDLFFRLLDFPLVVPPLRERRGDIPLLARHFVQTYGEQLGGGITDVRPDVLEILARHDWPGNVRELEKCLKRALVLARGDDRLRPEHLPRELVPYLAAGGTRNAVPLRETLTAVEAREIARALQAAAGNKAAAARALRVSYPYLLKKSRLFGLG